MTALTNVLVALSPAAEGHGGHDGGLSLTSPLMGSEGTLGLVWIFINFLALLWILNRLLFRPLRKRTEEKHEQIKAALTDATEARDKAKAIVRDYRGRLEHLEQEADELMAEAKQRGEADRKRIIAEAQAEADRIKATARASAEREAERKRKDIENEIIDRAIDKAEQVLRTRMGEGHQRRLVDDYIGQLGGVTMAGPGGGAR